MALVDDAVFTAATGYIYTGVVDVAPPTQQQIFDFVDETTTLTGFTIIGHTSRDELPEFGFDGGDTETRGTWQKAALRTVVTDPAVDYVTFQLVQFDADTFELYYGSENTATEVGTYSMVGTPGGETEQAILIVIVDGDNKIAFYASNTSLRRDDAISLSVDEFGAMPMRATILDRVSASTKPKLAWIPGIDTP